MRKYGNYICGEFRDSGEKIEVLNPSNGDKFAYIHEGSPQDIHDALSAADRALQEWKRFSFKERATVLRSIAGVILDNLSTLARIETEDIGKPYKESLFVDIPLAAECFGYYASLLETVEERAIKSDTGVDIINYDPYGICGVYLPYNVPLMIFGFTCAAALAAGNALIVKPSEWGALSLLELAKHLDDLDVPKGLINIVTGRGEHTGKALASSAVDLISFTGSRDTLKRIVSHTVDHPKKIICELGGANLAVVYEDADQERALENLLASSFMKQGQMCIGTSIALIEETIYAGFIEALLDKIRHIKIGDPFDATVGMGPLVSGDHLSAGAAHDAGADRAGWIDWAPGGRGKRGADHQSGKTIGRDRLPRCPHGLCNPA